MKKDSHIYYILYFLLYRVIYRYFIKRRFRSHYLDSEINLTPIKKEMSFFGYYVRSSINNRGDILFLASEKKYVVPGKDLIELRVIRKSDQAEVLIDKTRAWNWQQGAMLQWIGDNNDEVIYNIFNESTMKYNAVIKNLSNGKKRNFPFPVYSISYDGNFFLSLNFERLAMYRKDYGYFCNKEIVLPADAEDGIWYVDTKSRETKRIIDIAKLKRLKPTDSLIHSKIQKVNHIDISPNNKKAIFYHRWFYNGEKYTRLYLYDLEDCRLVLLKDDATISHCSWLTENTLLAYCILKDGFRGYLIIDCGGNETKILRTNMDGHPSANLKNRKLISTDSYPDKSGYSSLYIYNLDKSNLVEVGRFYQPFKYRGGKRVDLHPRWSMDGRMISFDSAHSGKRKQYAFSIDSLCKDRFI